jgi:hypothetical protein
MSEKYEHFVKVILGVFSHTSCVEVLYVRISVCDLVSAPIPLDRRQAEGTLFLRISRAEVGCNSQNIYLSERNIFKQIF